MYSYVPDAKRQKKNPSGEGEGVSMETLISGATSDVGPINPVQDFNVSRDSPLNQRLKNNINFFVERNEDITAHLRLQLHNIYII